MVNVVDGFFPIRFGGRRLHNSDACVSHFPTWWLPPGHSTKSTQKSTVNHGYTLHRTCQLWFASLLHLLHLHFHSSSTLFERSSSPTTQYVATTSSPQQIARQDRYESRILHCTCQDVRYTVLCCMYLGKTSRHDRRCTCESLNASEPRAWCYRRFSDL